MLIKKMIFKWTPGFCVSRSWQTREQLLAHLWGVDSPIPGPALDGLPGHRAGPPPSPQTAARAGRTLCAFLPSL